MKNLKKELYVVASGIFGIHSNPENTLRNYEDYIAELNLSEDCSIDEFLNCLEHDNNRTTYSALKNIVKAEPNWLNINDYDDYKVSGSVMLTAEQATKLEGTFFIYRMKALK